MSVMAQVEKGHSIVHLPESLKTDRAFTVVLLKTKLTCQNTGLPGHEGAEGGFAVL